MENKCNDQQLRGRKMKLENLKHFIRQYPVVYGWLQKSKRNVNNYMISRFGLDYVEETINNGPIKGMKFIAAKRVSYSKWFWNGTFEKEMCILLRKSISLYDICYDIGANLGYHALLMSDTAVDGHVYAFEPIPNVYNILKKNIDCNCKQNVTIVKKAVTCEVGKIQLGLDTTIDQAAQNFLTKEENRNMCENIECDCTTLDRFVEAGNRPPSLIKLDVEGAEVDVLKGGRNVLMRYHPIIFCEVHGRAAADEVYKILCEYGYELFVVHNGVAPICSISEMPISMYEGHVFARMKNKNKIIKKKREKSS